MSSVQFTSDELVRALIRSQLPTIVVEGRDDMTIYRWMEACDQSWPIDVMPCGGRDTLFEVFNRRSEFSHIPCVFIADRDMWLFSATLVQYRDIVFTKGYSIENDLLDGSLIGNLLSTSEHTEFNALCDALASWFAFEVEQYRRGEDYCVDIHPNQLVPLGTTTLNKNAVNPRLFREPNKRLVRSIRNKFYLKFRGKSLVALYTRILSAPRRASKYSRHNILEIASKCDSTAHTQRLSRLIRRKIQAQNKALHGHAV